MAINNLLNNTGDDYIKLLAPAKINLTLDVLFKRPDGYHELDGIMLAVSLYDTIYIKKSSETHIIFTGFEKPDNDSVTAAVHEYERRAKVPCPVDIIIEKSIPHQSGLGGASADAAATLNGMQTIYGFLNEHQLHEAALAVGADVPFCLYNRPVRAGGIGEKLRFLDDLNLKLYFLIVKPGDGISTAELFRSLKLPLTHTSTNEVEQSLIAGDISTLSRCIHNSLQAPAISRLPCIGSIIDRLKKAGAHCAIMTGAGSAAFGIFINEAEALNAKSHFSDISFCHVCTNI